MKKLALFALILSMASTSFAARSKTEACFTFLGKDNQNHLGYIKIEKESVEIIWGYKEAQSDYDGGSSGLIERTSTGITIKSLFVNPSWGDSYNMAIELTKKEFKVNYNINEDGVPSGPGKTYPVIDCP